MANNRYTRERLRRNSGKNGLIVGLVILGFGTMMLLKQMSVDLPSFLFKWEIWLIVFGLAIGFKNKFRDFGWAIMCFVGLFLLADDIWPDLPVRRFMWPVGIIVAGLVVIFSQRNRRRRTEVESLVPPTTPTTVKEGEVIDFEESMKQYNTTPSTYVSTANPNAPTEQLETVSVFGSVQRIVYSKNFTGGEIVCVFGGAEINLSQADFVADEIELEIVTIFGGATLFLPANWNVRTDSAVIFGGVEDKRKGLLTPGNKTIVLKGAAIFGGIEIKLAK